MKKNNDLIPSANELRFTDLAGKRSMRDAALFVADEIKLAHRHGMKMCKLNLSVFYYQRKEVHKLLTDLGYRVEEDNSYLNVYWDLPQ